MNLQSGRKKTNRVYSNRSVPTFGIAGFFWMVKIIIFMTVVGSLLAFSIDIQRKEKETSREIRRIEAENHRIALELENLRIKEAGLSSWGNISNKIKQFNLKLHPASAGQVYPMMVYSPYQAARINLRPVRMAKNNFSQRQKLK